MEPLEIGLLIQMLLIWGYCKRFIKVNIHIVLLPLYIYAFAFLVSCFAVIDSVAKILGG
jgi:hypothetical protein